MVDLDKKTPESLGALRYKDLQALAKGHGIRANQSKGALIEQIQLLLESKAPITPTNPQRECAGQSQDGAADQSPEESVDQPQDDAAHEPQDDPAHEPQDDSTDEPRDDSADEPQDDSADKTQYGSADQPQDGSTNMPVDESVDEHHGESADQTEDEPTKKPRCAAMDESQGTAANKPQDESTDTPEEDERERIPVWLEVVPPAAGEVGDLDRSERRKSRRLLSPIAKVLEEPPTTAAKAKATPRQSKSLKFVAKRPVASGSSNRFDAAHENIFNAQPSIERYGKTPKKTGPAKENMPAEKPALLKAQASASKANARGTTAGTPGPRVRPLVGSAVRPDKRSATAVSRPSTMVVQRSTKKPTQVKEFRLSSNTGNRERFTFKPYSGRVPPIAPALRALADKTPSFNVGRVETSAQGTQQPKKIEPVGIKGKLASGRAQAARRTDHAQSVKTQRENKVAKARLDRA